MPSSRVYPGLERVPGKQNWVDKAGGLPDYIERVAKHLHYEQGYTISRAIASAVSQIKKWIITGSPAVKAKAIRAIAQWNAKRLKKNLSDEEMIREVVINMSEAAQKKEGSKSAGVNDKAALQRAIALYRKNKAAGKYTPEQASKIEARLKSSQQRLGMKVGLSDGPKGTDASKHDLIFYENRRTPEVVPKGAEPKKTGGKAGKVKSRRAATAEEEKQIKNGKWVRVDSSGRKPGNDGYLSQNKSQGPDKKKNLSEKVELFNRVGHTLSLSEQQTVKDYLEREASREGVTINLAATTIPVGSTIARNTRFNPSKHRRGFGGRFAPKAQ